MLIGPILAVLLAFTGVDGDGPRAPTNLEQVLARAYAFQRGSASQVREGSLHGRFRVAVRKPDGSGMIEAEVERSYQRQPPRMLTRRIDSLAGSDTSVGWNGSLAWFADNQSGDVRIYSDDPETFETDLADLAWQLRLMALVHDALVLEKLVERMEHTTLLGQRERVSIPSRRRRRNDPGLLVDVVTGRLVDELFEADSSAPPPLPGAPQPRLLARLSLDAESGALVRVQLTSLERQPPRTLDLWLMNFGTNQQGLVVPMTILVQENGLETLRLGLAADDEGYPEFELGLPLDEALFAPPHDEASAGSERDAAPAERN